MLKNLFGGKKKSGYFLELKEENSQKKEKTSPSEVPTQPEAEKQPEIPAQSHTVEEKAAESEPSENKNQNKTKKTKTSIKSKKSPKAKEKQPEAAPAQDEVPLLSPFPTSVAASSQNGKVEPQEVAFASKYLLTPTTGRRRPGPSLNNFKSMARQVKKPGFKG